ncbi:MAG: MOSC domain-containing protein [Halopseudomonas sp.]|uniref:MOSC domain-containing protein n=1 Tax=Halopseudomonas sp. TaxID=2901191 RepID=UPI003001A7D5
MRMLGRVSEIWRYPVKGMAGESLTVCPLTGKGLEGDRLWAVRDIARNEIQSCKFRPRLLQVIARQRAAVGQTVELLLPDGAQVSSDDPQVHGLISRLLGHESRLEPLSSQTELAAFRRYKAEGHAWLEELKATFAREVGEPLPDFTDLPQAMVDYVSLPGSYFLVSPLHLLTTASLDYLRARHPQSDWDTRRFRPNLVIDTLDSQAGLVEQSWLGGKLQLGEAELRGTAAAPRCGAVTRAQQRLPADSRLLRAVVSEADQNLGIYADTVQPGMLRVGDAVYRHP